MKYFIDGLTAKDILHLEERQEGSPRELVARLELLGERMDAEGSRMFRCERCGAAEGTSCTKPNGKPAKDCHVARVDVWLRFRNATTAAACWTRNNYTVFGMCEWCWEWAGKHRPSCITQVPMGIGRTEVGR